MSSTLDELVQQQKDAQDIQEGDQQEIFTKKVGLILLKTLTIPKRYDFKSGAWIPAVTPPDAFLSDLVEIVIHRINAVVQSRVDHDSVSCGVHWTPAYLQEAFLLLCEKNNGLLAYEKAPGEMLEESPEVVSQEMAGKVTILGKVPLPDWKLGNKHGFFLGHKKLELKSVVQALYKWLRQEKGEVQITGCANDTGPGSMSVRPRSSVSSPRISMRSHESWNWTSMKIISV